MADQYSVVGNPIKHSKSPQIHAEFAKQTDQDLEYHTKLIELGEFAEDVNAYFQQGGCGLNVTVPFKQEAWELAEELSEAARLAGAVNTLYLNDQGVICGDNTDGVGMVRDLQKNHGVEIKGRRVLVLGAGGAVRGVLEPLLSCQPEQVFIANRTAAKATALATDFSALGAMKGGGFDQLGGPFDLVINGTSASLQGDLPPLPDNLLAPGACCY
ncbi:MAG: shikimate dehydrogenase, partial [Motiliproteus sp.]|nr:shikimate dehydrogenase [Motiliproteus sp.]